MDGKGLQSFVNSVTIHSHQSRRDNTDRLILNTENSWERAPGSNDNSDVESNERPQTSQYEREQQTIQFIYLRAQFIRFHRLHAPFDVRLVLAKWGITEHGNNTKLSKYSLSIVLCVYIAVDGLDWANEVENQTYSMDW